MQKVFIILFFLLSAMSFGQTATIKSTKVYRNEDQSGALLRFEFNGQAFGEKDTLIQIRINTKGFDQCRVILDRDTLRFLTKFRADEMYEIRQGCCCAAFTMEAVHNPRRGVVSFKNKTKRAISLEVAEANVDTVNAGKTRALFAAESAMCYFKPCIILLTETEYFSDRYNYKKGKRDYEELLDERQKFVLGEIWFHFLHGEKIAVTYDEQLKTVALKLKGYLSEKEHNDLMWK